VDGLGRTPPTARLFSEPGRTLLVLGTPLRAEVRKSLFNTGAELMELPSEDGIVNLSQMLKVLGERQITSILVEAGGILLGSLFDRKLVDKVVAFLAPIIIGGEEARPSVAGKGIASLADCTRLKRVKVESVGEDIMVVGYVTG
jgi:diaminohydroxyphosphoribosylaminopyrimidine deaminase / 5-amino-6-(5-phosphoribosylamino)uracil reductase